MSLIELAASLVPTGMKLPILGGPLRGCRWIAGAAAGCGKGLSVVLHRAERAQLELARSWVTPQSVCFDIGANVGLYTLLFGRYGGRVVAFEPLPRNLQYLSRTVEINRLRNVTIVPWAVSDKVELTRFELGENCALGRLGSGGSQPVACVSVDEFIDRYGLVPDVMKIDVEGAEAAVLAGCGRLFQRCRPRILLSVHSADLRRQCLDVLAAAGYRHFQPLEAQTVESAMELAVAADIP